MKKILLTAVLGTLCIFSHAQVTLSLLATESTCENNGSIEATANGVSPYSYELTGPQTDSQFDPGTVNFNSLIPGIYTVSVTDNAGQSTSENIEVTGNYVQPDLNIAVTNVSCPAGTDGGLVATMSDGLAPYEYEVLSGPLTFPRGSMNSFSPLPAGTYTVRAYDQCDNFQTRTVEIIENYTPVRLFSVGSNTGRKTSCSQTRYAVTGFDGSPTYQYRIIDPVDYATAYQSSGEFFTPFDTSARDVTFEVLDQCGQTATTTMDAPTVSLRRSISGFTCSGFDLTLSPSNMIEPISYEIVNGPNGPQSLSGPNVGPVDFGTYTISATDACGITRTQTFTEEYTAPTFLALTERPSSCEIGAANATIQLDVPNTGNLVPNIEFTLNSFPPEYIGPTTFTSNNNNTTQFQLDPLVPGNYNITVEDACGATDNFDITVTEALTAEVQTTLTPGCLDNNQIEGTFITNGNSSFGSPWRLYEIGTDALIQGPNSTGLFTNVPAGDYYVEYRKCTNLLIRDTVEVVPYIQPDLTNALVVSCADGTATVTANPTGGIGPYSYEIIDGPAGQTYPIGPQASPVFENLLAGNNYRVRISDACGNSSSEDVSSQPIPVIIATVGVNCDGETFSLFAEDSLLAATYTWTLPDGSMVSGDTLELTNLSVADEGTYTLDASIGTCANAQATYELSLTTCALPVEWLYFDAEVQQPNEVLLSWATASEENNDYFSIEISSNGYDWDEIGRVEGQGTSTVTNTYSFIDVSPRSGSSYYRLKQVDYDGSFAYSEIESVSFEQRVVLYPNPGRDVVYFAGLSMDDSAVVELYDIAGRVVLTQDADAVTGGLDVSQLPSGAYFIVVRNSGEVLFTQKWLKQ